MVRETRRTVPLAGRLAGYLVIDALAITGLTLWNGDSWLTELKHGVLPAVAIAAVLELYVYDERRRRARQS